MRAFTHKKRGDAVCTGVCTHLRCRLVKAFNGTVAFSLLPCRPLPANTTLPANRPEPLLATRLYGDEWREDDELKKKKGHAVFLAPPLSNRSPCHAGYSVRSAGDAAFAPRFPEGPRFQRAYRFLLFSFFLQSLSLCAGLLLVCGLLGLEKKKNRGRLILFAGSCCSVDQAKPSRTPNYRVSDNAAVALENNPTKLPT